MCLALSGWHQQEKDFHKRVVRDVLIENLCARVEISLDLVMIDFLILSSDIAFYGKRRNAGLLKSFSFN